MYGKLSEMVVRHCFVGVVEKHDDCRLRPMAREAGVLDGSLYPTLTADIQT